MDISTPRRTARALSVRGTAARLITASCLALATALLAGAMTPAHGEITWTNYTTANGLGHNSVEGVYASGSTIYAATLGGLSVSTNNGSSWITYTTGSGLASNGVRDVYAAGSNIYAATYNGLSVSTNNGTSWTNYDWSSLGSSDVRRVYASGSTIYAATAGGLSVSTNNGTSWTRYTTTNGLGSYEVHDVYASGSTIYVATGQFRMDGPPVGGVSISTNNGSSWSNYTTANGLGSNIVYGIYASGSSIYAATDYPLSISTNNGISWTNYDASNSYPIGYSFSDVYASGSTIYAATRYDGLSISTNNGTSWTNYTTTNGLGSNSVYGVYASGSTIYAATAGGLSIGVAAVPEPSTWAMALAGLAYGGFSLWQRRNRIPRGQSLSAATASCLAVVVIFTSLAPADATPITIGKKVTATKSGQSSATWSAIHCGPTSCPAPKRGHGRVSASHRRPAQFRSPHEKTEKTVTATKSGKLCGVAVRELRDPSPSV